MTARITKKIRKINGREVTVWGANADLMAWAKNSPLYKSLANQLTDFDNKIFLTLGSPSQDERIIYAKEIIEDLWGIHPEFGPYPFLDTLSEFQFDRVFYSGYRDHVCHQLKVFLLGIAFFEGLTDLRKSILAEIGGAENESIDEFMRRWIVTAIYHDIGYVIENKGAVKSFRTTLCPVRDKLNSTLAYPLSNLLIFKNKINSQTERNIIDEYKIWYPQINVLKDIEYDCKEDLLKLIKQEAIRANLGPEKFPNIETNVLRRYYDYAFAYQPIVDNRSRFRDHGIASALLLLKTWRSYSYYIERLPMDEPLLSCINDKLVDIKEKITNSNETIRAAAAAIALHNLDKKIWNVEETVACGLTLSQYEIDYQWGDEENKKRTPLAFLLVLTDTLQDWDRQKFRSPLKNQAQEKIDQDMSIKVNDDKIYLFFQEDESKYKDPTMTKDSHYSKAITTLKACLNKAKIDSLVRWNKQDNEEEPHKKENLGKEVCAKTKIVNGVTINDCDIKKMVQETEWIVGAMNFDEDLHFSSFYTRRSCLKYLPEEYKVFGYTKLIAVYEDFNETYYIPKKECIRVAEDLFNKIADTPLWLQDIIDQIYRLAEELKKVFPYKEEIPPFNLMSKEELYKRYKLHNEKHIALYEVARIPEALDRGIGVFTNYLKDYLKNRGHQLANSSKELNKIFDKLTFPEKMSQAVIEITELHTILQDIKQSEKKQVFTGGSIRALLRMEPEIIQKIMKHRSKWSFWGYHGYGARALPDINYYIQRVFSALTDNGDDSLSKEKYLDILKTAEDERVLNFRKYRIDGNHQMLFRLYSRVGIVKLYRRYVQLRNFFYLDHLLSEISKRLNIAEAVIRSLLPEELENILDKGGKINESQIKRTDFVVHIINKQNEFLYPGNEYKWIQQELNPSKEFIETGEKVYGTSISTGIVRGKAKIVIRKEDAEKVIFRRGDILISESTDPDLVDIINKASGVITESGGMTCHAAIICRELHKPGLTGVKNLLKIVKNDDFLVLNADEGYFNIINYDVKKNIIFDTNISDNPTYNLGPKANNLFILIKANINVPRFFVIPWSIVYKNVLLSNPDTSGSVWNELVTEVNIALEYLNTNIFIIRSSMQDEDCSEYSSAGKYISESNIERMDVALSLSKYVRSICFNDLNESHQGSVIIQEMILGDISGICFTADPITGDENKMIIEVIPGGNDLLTEGKVIPVRYEIEKATKTVIKEESLGHWQGLIPKDMLNLLIDKFIKIEKIFQSSQDIEWTIQKKDIWILQSRPITMTINNKKEGKNKRALTASQISRDIISIYRSYRVPPNIKEHLLKSAAVGSVICDEWKGKKLNKQDIVLTLLLHDIGNSVKIDYDRYPKFFSEELQNIQYWKAVQSNIKERYGSSDQEVTVNIAKELSVSDRIIELLKNKLFINNEKTVVSEDWELKICAYADQRVSPFGVLPLIDRLKEAKERYKGINFASVNNPKYEIFLKCAIKIEEQIAKNVKIDLNAIDDAYIQGYYEELRNFILPN